MAQFTPESLFRHFNEATWKKESLGKITLSGIYHAGNGNYQRQDGKYIDYLEDEVTKRKMTILLTTNIRQFIKEGNVVEISGFLDRYIDPERCTLTLQIIATFASVLNQFSRIAVEEYDRFGIRQRKIASGYKSVKVNLVDILENGRRPRIAILLPGASIVASDIFSGLGSAASSYDISTHQVSSFSNSDELCEKLKSLDPSGYDCIVLSRGGGVSFSNLLNPELLGICADLSTPLVTALGHEEEKPFIQEIADMSFSTPTAFGSFLKEISQAAQRHNQDIFNMEKAIWNLKESQGKYKKALSILATACILLLVATVYLLAR